MGIKISQSFLKKSNLEKGSQVQIFRMTEGIMLNPINRGYILEELFTTCEGENPYSKFFSQPIEKEKAKQKNKERA